MPSDPIQTGEIYSLLYSSYATAPFDDRALQQLLQLSRRKNHQAGITGILLHREGRFIQFLEGPRHEVEALYQRITADERHRDVHILIDGPVGSRNFSDWSMGYTPITATVSAPPEGFRDSFNDLDAFGDTSAVTRVARELTIWFRIREGATVN